MHEGAQGVKEEAEEGAVPAGEVQGGEGGVHLRHQREEEQTSNWGKPVEGGGGGRTTGALEGQG